MKIYQEIPLSRFEFWSSARDHADWLSECEFNALEAILEELYPDGISATQLNDIMRFDFELVCDWLSIEDPYRDEEE